MRNSKFISGEYGEKHGKIKMFLKVNTIKKILCK